MKTATRIQKAEGRRQKAEGRNRKPVSDSNASVLPATHFARGASRAFSLIELLVVIGVIVILASMTFPIIGAVKRAQTLHRARAELTQIESAIENYKTKLGFYPPDNPLNPPNWAVNQLYYELMGTTLKMINGQLAYETLDGSAQLATNSFGAAFGSNTKVVGFMNSSRAGGGDDVAGAVKFLVALKPAQFLAITNGGPATPVRTVLGVSVIGVPVLRNSALVDIIPYCYNSSNPQHNPKSFDLWIDVIASGKTNRISNWSDKPIIISTTAYL